jgi:hypothetical protein
MLCPAHWIGKKPWVIDPESVRDEYAKAKLQRQIDATDAQIHKLVYELYELSEDEIKIVESATT